MLKSELEVMWWMMRFWCADTRRGVGDEHCSADSGGGDVRAPPALSDHSCNRKSINQSIIQSHYNGKCSVGRFRGELTFF